MGKRIYATYNGTKDIRPQFAKEGKAGKLQLCWTGVRSGTGELMKEKYSNPALAFKGIKKGSRYVIDFKEFEGDRLIFPTKVRRVGKNLNCKLIRKLDDNDYIFINGKFAGKKVSEIVLNDKQQLNSYLIWTGENTYNEATIINVLNILEMINYVQ